MAAQSVTKQVVAAKETSEIYDAVVALLQAAIAGKKAGLSGVALAGTIAAAGLPALSTAIDGISGIKEEHEQELGLALVAHGLGAGQISAAIAQLVKG